MALTETQKRELEAKKDFGVRDQVKEEWIEKQREIKQAIRVRNRGIADAAKAQAAKDNSLDWDGESFFNKKTGDEKRPLQVGKVERTARNLIEKEFSGYNDWSVAMQSLLGAAVQLGRALYYDPIKWLNFVPYSDEIGAGLPQAGDWVWDKTIGWASDKIDGKLVTNDKLPKIRFSVAINNGNIDTLVTKDDKSIAPDPSGAKINACFKEGVLDWAKVHGYEQKRGSMGLQDASGAKMTAEKFKELNDDPDTSLEKFLTNRLGMSANYSGPSTSPSP
ncbi:hypothetical protein Lnau_1658 [Legionella nautarum]|uniref:Membrane-associated HD superfamily hydrolase n=1 Tax=Legionella nautarum TaxID=45070 RepID=A0A0W0WWH8_9GAMM|nr:hypothetical protein [Legionella nautarum]KTD36674.1 hypothetical protein Lnau_1658 [Legionella nautarum]